MKKKLLALAACSTLVLGACGGDDGDSAEGTATTQAATETTAAATETTAAAATSAAPTTTAATATSAGATATTAAVASGPVTVSLKEWSVDASASLRAGSQTFAVTNDGSFPHEFVVMKGTYAALPQSATGTVLEDQLAAGALIGRSDPIEVGESVEVTFDLPAGQYVLLCNISVGPNSHAGKGQRLDVTVS